MYLVQVVSTGPFSFWGTSLEWLCLCKQWAKPTLQDVGESEESSIAWAQLKGQAAVMSFPWAPLTSGCTVPSFLDSRQASVITGNDMAYFIEFLKGLHRDIFKW